MYQYYPMMDGYGSGWGFVMALLWLAFFVAIIILVVRLLKPHHDDSSRGPNPLDIARERYAKGEITKEQFEQLIKDLK